MKDARAIAVEYKKLMELKKNLEDWDASLLSPPPAIDRMWHLHILDVKGYTKSCQEFCGQLIGHDPDGGIDAKARRVRIERTKTSIQAKNGRNYNKRIWSFGDDDSPPAPASAARNTVSDERDDEARVGRAAETNQVSHPRIVRVRDNDNGKETFFKIGSNTPMRRIFAYFEELKGVEAGDLYFLLDGERIEPDQTPDMLELDDYDQIDVLRSQSGC